jgi:ATP-binding cassette subfamily F protein uup
MEAAIAAAEAEKGRCRAAAEDPAIGSDSRALTECYAALAAAEAEVERLYARWAELEALLD